MSHVAIVEAEFKDLDALSDACKRLGLELVRGQSQYKWWGQSVGDYPLPEGFSAEELGKCEHAIRIPGDENAFEIGVVRRRDGKPGYALMWDFYGGGYGLQAKVGEGCKRLKQAYAVSVASRQAVRSGFRVQERVLADGSVRLQLSK